MLAQEIALKLGLNTRTILDFVHKGVITPARDRHGRWQYTEAHIAAIREHIAARKVPPIPDVVLVPRTFNRTRGC